MKKLLALLLALTAVSALAGCGGSKDIGADYANMTAEELIKETIKDRANPTDEEIEVFIGTGAYATVNEKNVFDENITDEAIVTLTKEMVKPAMPINYAEKLLDSEDMLVRAFVYDSFSDYTPLEDEALENLLIEKVKAETDKVAVSCALKGLANALSERIEFAEFAASCADNEDAAVRYWAANALGFYRLEDNEVCVDAMIKLIKDSDTEVAKEACKEAGNFGNDKVIPVLTEVLSDEALVDIHGSATESLEKLWMGYPLYKGNSEAAYRAHLAYLTTETANPKIPAWTAISSIKNAGGKFEEWKAVAPYFNASELVAALSKVVCDADADKLAKTTAIQKIGEFGTKEELETLKASVAGDDSLVSKIDAEISKK